MAFPTLLQPVQVQPGQSAADQVGAAKWNSFLKPIGAIGAAGGVGQGSSRTQPLNPLPASKLTLLRPSFR